MDTPSTGGEGGSGDTRATEAGAPLRIAEPQAAQAQSNKRRHTSLEKMSFFIALLAFLLTARQAYIMSDNEIQTLRAYAFVDSTTITIDENNLPSANVTIRNFGATPASQFRHWACAFVRTIPAADSSFPDFMKGIDAPGTDIPPHGVKDHPINGWCELPNGTSLNEIERAAIRSGAKAVYISGVARYQDVFGFDHITRYGRYWNDKYKVSIDDYSGNCTDDECEPRSAWQKIGSRFWRF